MIDFNSDYPDRISILGKKIFADGKVIYVNKGGTLTLFYLLLIMQLSVLSVTIFVIFPMMTGEKFSFYLIFVGVACYLSHDLCNELIDMFSMNQLCIDYEKAEVVTINIFKKKSIYHVNDLNNLKYYYRMFFWSEAFRYKIILKNENQEFVIMSFFSYRYEVKEICEFTSVRLKKLRSSITKSIY